MIDNQFDTPEVIENQVQEPVAPIGDEVPEVASPVASPAPVAIESDYDKNIKNLRLKAERQERELQDARRRLESYETKQTPEEDYSLNLGEADLAEGKHLSKMQRQHKIQVDELRKANAQTQNLLIELKLKSELPDIDKVVTEDNIQLLKELHPELAYSINSNNDYYTKAKSAYKILTGMGIYKRDDFSSDRESAERNATKPRPLASVSPQQADSPLSRANAFANGLTPELKAQLIKEMEAACQNL